MQHQNVWVHATKLRRPFQLTATVTDPDTVQADTVRWQWARSSSPLLHHLSYPYTFGSCIVSGPTWVHASLSHCVLCNLTMYHSPTVCLTPLLLCYLTPLSLSVCVCIDYSRQVQEEILAQNRAYDDLLRKIADHTPNAPSTSDRPLSPSRPLDLATCLRDFLNPHILPPFPFSPSSPLSSPRLPRNDDITTAYQRYYNTFTDFTQVSLLS